MTPMRRRGSLTLLVLVAAGAAAASYLILRPSAPKAARPEPPPPPTPAPAVVCLGHVDVEGGVAALGPAQPGRVIELCMHEGDAVAAGAVLLRLDDRPARFEAEQARAALEAARARLTRALQDKSQHPARVAQQRAAVESAEHRLTAAQQHLLRQQELLKINNTSVRDVSAAESQVKDLEAQVKAARERLAELNLSDPALPVREAGAEVAAAEARLRQAEYTVAQCELRAPSAGTILRVQAAPGEIVGGPAGTAPFQFCPEHALIVRAEVEQEFVRRVAVGQRAEVEDEADPGASWPGRVVRVAGWYAARRSAPDRPAAFKDVPTVECIIALDGGRPPLRVGQRVQVVIGAGE
jgi:multidrug resistance efflux pump